MTRKATIAAFASLPALLAVSLVAVLLSSPPARADSLIAVSGSESGSELGSPDVTAIADDDGNESGDSINAVGGDGLTAESLGKLVAEPISSGMLAQTANRAEAASRQLEQERLLAADKRYEERGGVLSSDGKTIYAAESGKVTDKVVARDIAGWDYTDWAFVQRMARRAEETDSSTDWFISVDVEAPVRLVLFHRESGTWVPVGGWYCTTGRKYIASGLPREAGGAHVIENKWEPDTGPEPAGPGYCLDFIASYPDGILPSAGGRNDSASFHCGVGKGEWGYNNLACISVTFDRSRWMYENIPVRTGVYIDGRCGGIGSTDGMAEAEIHTSTIDDPFIR